MSSAHVVLRGAHVLLGDPRSKQIEQVDVRIDSGIIAEIGPNLDPADADVIDYSDCWIIPGFVDAHEHVWQSVLRGRFANLLVDEASVIVRDLVSNTLEPEDVYAGTYGGAVAMLDAGVTCVFDHCDAVRTLEHGRSGILGLRDAGIRGVWGYGFDSVAPSSDSSQRLDDARTLGAVVSDDPLLTLGVIPSEIVDLAQVRAQIALGAELGAPILTHTDARHREGGSSDSEVLLNEGLLSARHVHAYCSTTPDAMFEEFARLGNSIVSTPDVELGGGLGYTALRHSYKAGVNTAIGAGSQAVASSDMFAVMRLGMQSERMRYQQATAQASGTSGIDRIAVRTEEVLFFATLGGARALGLEDVCGSIEVGKAADLIVIRPTSPRLVPLIDPMVAIVMHMGVADIDAVLVGGNFRKRSGTLVDGVAARAMDELDSAHARITSATSARLETASA